MRDNLIKQRVGITPLNGDCLAPRHSTVLSSHVLGSASAAASWANSGLVIYIYKGGL